MRSSTARRSAVLGAVLAGLFAVAAAAQVPPPGGSEAADIAQCLCLQQAVDALGADRAAKQHDYDAAQAEVARLDAELQRRRERMNVDNPEAVARFRQLLEQRDAAFRRSTGPALSALSAAVERYNARVGEYNAHCANRPRDAALLARVQATLSCPPPY
jgi:hypothetical protein